MELEGKRGKYFRSGVFIDVGAERDGFLHVNEWGDGFPEEQMFARNVPVKVRVLGVDGGRLQLTCRSGSLDRPPPFEAPVPEDADIEAFDQLGPEDVLDGEVVRLSLFGIFVKVQAPGSQNLEGLLHKSKMSEDLKKTVHVGMSIKVKLLKEQEWKQQKRIFLASPDYPS